MDLGFAGYLGVSRAELAHRLLRLIQVRRLTAHDVQIAGSLAPDLASSLVRGRVHALTQEQLRATLDGLCQRAPERRRR